MIRVYIQCAIFGLDIHHVANPKDAHALARKYFAMSTAIEAITFNTGYATYKLRAECSGMVFMSIARGKINATDTASYHTAWGFETDYINSSRFEAHCNRIFSEYKKSLWDRENLENSVR